MFDPDVPGRTPSSTRTPPTGLRPCSPQHLPAVLTPAPSDGAPLSTRTFPATLRSPPGPLDLTSSETRLHPTVLDPSSAQFPPTNLRPRPGHPRRYSFIDPGLSSGRPSLTRPPPAKLLQDPDLYSGLPFSTRSSPAPLRFGPFFSGSPVSSTRTSPTAFHPRTGPLRCRSVLYSEKFSGSRPSSTRTVPTALRSPLHRTPPVTLRCRPGPLRK